MATTDVRIVLADDDPGHAALVRRCLARAGISNPLSHVENGQEALDYLFRRGAHAGRVPNEPLLLLLDINMPLVDGVEVLRRVKADPMTRAVPVVMLTTTDDPREVRRCYDLGCNLYLTKPVHYEGFVETLRRLGECLQVAEFARESGVG